MTTSIQDTYEIPVTSLVLTEGYQCVMGKTRLGMTTYQNSMPSALRHDLVVIDSHFDRDHIDRLASSILIDNHRRRFRRMSRLVAKHYRNFGLAELSKIWFKRARNG